MVVLNPLPGGGFARSWQASLRRGAIPGAFELVDTQFSTTGAVLHVYERAGDLRYGTVEVGQETVIFDNADGADR